MEIFVATVVVTLLIYYPEPYIPAFDLLVFVTLTTFVDYVLSFNLESQK
jgi:hypothetical protein